VDQPPLNKSLNKAPVSQPPLNKSLNDGREDRNDHHLSNDQRESIAELNRKIGLIRQNQAPDAFTIERERVLNRAETNRLTQMPTSRWLDRVHPPWDSARGEAIQCYNDMMVEDFKQRIREIRARSDAAKLAKAKGGPGGSRAPLATTSELTHGLATTLY
jgi:hypothetical protein